jgi:parallel beta-helix repeat protein
MQGNSRVYIENCRVQHNRDFGVRVINSSQVSIINSSMRSTGFRVGTANNVPIRETACSLKNLPKA